MAGKYDDIINLQRPLSPKHPRMTMHERAGQFASFAALTGYDEGVKEMERFTDSAVILSDDRKEELFRVFEDIRAGYLGDKKFTVTFFVNDSRKQGGFYRTEDCFGVKIDDSRGALILREGESVPLDMIYSITYE